MKKVKLSLAALTLVLAIAGTTMANKVHKPGLCSVDDPKGTKCIGGDFYCCTDDVTMESILYNPFK